MSNTEKENPTLYTNSSVPAERPPHRIPLFQLIVGMILLIAGVTAVLYMSNVWTSTEVRYVEAMIVASLGTLLVATAVRPQAFHAFR